MGKSVREPIQPKSLFDNAVVNPDMLGTVKTQGSVRESQFDASKYEFLDNASYYDNPEQLEKSNAAAQPMSNILARTSNKFWANLVSSAGQGLANTYDLHSLGRSAKNMMDGTPDDFESSFFGITTRDMQAWNDKIQQRNKIYEKQEGNWDVTDAGWWGNQIASAGTGVGMAVEAAGSTLLIGSLTGGLGIAGAIGKLGQLGKAIMAGRNGAKVLSAAANAAKGMKSAATIYGIMSRASESRMESMQSYDEIYAELSKETNSAGEKKYTEEEVRKLAGDGARVTMGYNLALMPLDILAYRTMVFNPVSGAATGLIEKGLAKIGNKALRNITQFGVGATFEGVEEGFQFIGSQEGKHYARVLAGLDVDQDNVIQRTGEYVKKDEFWNSFSGGVIGSPIISGTMRGVNKILSGSSKSRLNSMHKHQLTNIAKMDARAAEKIAALDYSGDHQGAYVNRKRFANSKALGALHADELVGKTSAFDAYITYVDGVIGELNEGKTTALEDMAGVGFGQATPEHLERIKQEFQEYSKDAKQMKALYDNLKFTHSASVLPMVVQDHFDLGILREAKSDVDQRMAAYKATVMADPMHRQDELSAYGKELFQYEHELAGLQDLKDDLIIERGVKRSDPIILSIDKRAKEIEKRVGEINKDDSYNHESGKDKDYTLLNAAVVDSKLRAGYYHTSRAAFEVDKKTAEVANWNNAEYQKERVNQSIRKNSNKAVLEKVKEELSKKKNPKPEDAATALEAQKRQKELELEEANKIAEAAKKAAAANGNPNTNPIKKEVIGNQSLFGEEDKALLEGLGAGMPNQNYNAETTDSEEFHPFAPQQYDFDKSGTEAKEAVKRAIGIMLDKLGPNATFEQLLSAAIYLKGKAHTENIFNAIRFGWTANGKPDIDFKAVYDKVFAEEAALLDFGVANLQVTDKQVADDIKETTDKIDQKKEGATSFDAENQPAWEYRGHTTNEHMPKMAFSSRLSAAFTKINEDGVHIVDHEYIQEGMNTGDYVESLVLLDPDKYRAGTLLEVRRPDNFLDIFIPIYDELGEKQTPMKFGQYVAEKGLTESDQEYKDKIPLIVYDRGATGKGVSFVHDIGWYNPVNFRQEKSEDMQLAVAATRRIREKALSNPGVPTNITVVQKRETTFAPLKSTGQLYTLDEANPDSTIAISLDGVDLYVDKSGNPVYKDSNGVLINVKGFNQGQILDVRRYGVNAEGVPTYVALPVFQEPLSPEVKETLVRALEIYGSLNNNNPTVRAKHDKVIADIKSTMKLDISTPRGLQEFFEMFVPIMKTNTAGVEDVGLNIQETAKARPREVKIVAEPFLAIDHAGNFHFGRAGVPKVSKDGKTTYQTSFVNPKTEKFNDAILQSYLGDFRRLLHDKNAQDNGKQYFKHTVSTLGLATDIPVMHIDANSTASIANPSYKKYVRTRLKSNIKSHNIGTEANPKYVTNAQPIITFDLDERIGLSKQHVTPAQTAAETTPKPVSPSLDLEALKAEIEAKAKRDLGKNSGFSSRKFAAQELDHSERNQFNEVLKSIAGLRADEDYELVNYMYNILEGLIGNGTVIEKERALAEIELAFRTLTSEKKAAYRATIAEYVELAKTTGLDLQNVIDDYAYELEKIETVEKNINLLTDKALARSEKYNNIKSDRVKTSELYDTNDEDNEDGEDNNPVDDETLEKTRDFYTDILTENPEHKLTRMMRKLFSGIRERDKNGEIIRGFVGVDTYVPTSTVVRTLMERLADVPADFDIMMAKLRKLRDDNVFPWMGEVVAKLEESDQNNKNRFVTVMSNTRLRMKFTMITPNKKNGTYKVRIFDTSLNGIAEAVKAEWKDNFTLTRLAAIRDGEYTIDEEVARDLMRRYEHFVGQGYDDLQASMEYLKDPISRIKPNSPMTRVINNPDVLNELKQKLTSVTAKLRVVVGRYEYLIQRTSTDPNNNIYQVSLQDSSLPNKEAAQDWLAEFGIVLTPDTMEKMHKGKLKHNYQNLDYHKQFSSDNGIFRILYKALDSALKNPNYNFTENGHILNNTVITSLANEEAHFNETTVPFGFRDGKKSFFALTANKFITDRVKELKLEGDDQNIREHLKKVSFSKHSMWLQLLDTNSKFRQQFNVAHIGVNAIKLERKRLFKENRLDTLPDQDHELTKLGMFWDSFQGDVSEKYPGTSIMMRMATMFSPTESDKQTITLITTGVLSLQASDLMRGDGVSDELVGILFDQLVRPELHRITNFYRVNPNGTDIKGYDAGAGLFMLLPELNNLKDPTSGHSLIDSLKSNRQYDASYVENNPDIRKDINEVIRNYVKTLTEEKLASWETSKIAKSFPREDGTIHRELPVIDQKYAEKFKGYNPDQQVKMIAMDFVINSLIANANSFMLIAGDPAMYYKADKNEDGTEKTILERIKDTFSNVGKRLANQIAPGTTIANSLNEEYLQIFLKDRLSESENIEYLREILGDGAKAYTSLEAADGQEYTTWKEHIDILRKMGKTSDVMQDVTDEELDQISKFFENNEEVTSLTARQLKVLNQVVQPIKPVYTNQIYDPKQDVMRTVYIKSSSFPLIPHLTRGKEIDKLRIAMEQLQAPKSEQNPKGKGLNVRASYQSANKVGAMKVTNDTWDKDGNAVQLTMDNLESQSLRLPRKGFRIQQEVPFKSSKAGDDVVTLGTQLMKLLFGDDVIAFGSSDPSERFMLDGKPMSGEELHREYNDTFISLIGQKRDALLKKLGVDKEGNVENPQKFVTAVRQLLEDEAKKRNYPLQDIEGLQVTKSADGKWEFNFPLWASTNSNRYEAMLNSVVTNRLIRMKFPGNSFVAGSEEGFKKQEDFEGIDTSQIIYTDAWNGTHLTASEVTSEGFKKAQVFVPSKFKDANGELIDLFKKKNGKYIYITEKEGGGYNLNMDMFDKELLSFTTFRTPTSGLQSASEVEIAGFLPIASGDLIIVPRNFTKQKGLDFDVDKESTYRLWTHVNEDGKYEVLREEHRNGLLAKADKMFDNTEEGKLMRAIFGDYEYDEDDINSDKKLAKLNALIDEKLAQNKLIKIYSAVMSVNHNKIQSKISKVLSTDFAQSQAALIDKLTSTTTNDKYWTPMSDEYQKSKVFLGASGKTGTAAYSLDLVFNSSANQLKFKGQPIKLIMPSGEEGVPPVNKIVRFGSYSSDGVLGHSKTISGDNVHEGDRTVSDVLTERQQIAVDNEKLQVMGRIGLDNITMDVDKIITLLGFDKGSDGNAISLLFLSQPIIKEFIKALKNSRSLTSDYSESEEELINDILKRYGAEEMGEDENELEYINRMDYQMTNENFISNLSGTVNNQLQRAVLRKFLDLREYGLKLRGVQTAINADSKGLGKSFFDIITKREGLNKLGTSPSTGKEDKPAGKSGQHIAGAESLIGIFRSKAEINNPREIRALLNEGYVDIGDYIVKPTTLSGAFNLYGLSTGYNLWSNFFPYDYTQVKATINKIERFLRNNEDNDVAKTETRQEIFRHIKKYAFASRNNGVISINDDINAERQRLYMDSDENTSLASYVKQLMEYTGDEAVERFIRNNALLNRFEFRIETTGKKPSLIKFNNTIGEEFDEQYLYDSLSNLLQMAGPDGNIQLPTIGNKSYTLATLAQDLIAYTYLGNATQEAIQFTKYVPLTYLEIIKLTDRMREASKHFESTKGALGASIGMKVGQYEDHIVREFVMQYIQHHPEKITSKYSDKKLNKLITKYPGTQDSFVFKDKRTPTFVAVYDYKVESDKSFRLYWYDGEKYVRIPVLGSFGMDEYQPGRGIGYSIINKDAKNMPIANEHQYVKSVRQEVIKQDKYETPFNGATKNLNKVLQSITDANDGFHSTMAKALMKHTTGVKLDIQSQVEVNGRVMTAFRGMYNPQTQTIIINSNVTDPESFADAVIHELIHHLVDHELKAWTVTDPITGMVSLNSLVAPQHVEELVTLFNVTKAKVNQDYIKGAKDKLARVRAGEKEVMFSETDIIGYAFLNISEFVTYTMASKKFLSYLNTIEYDQKTTVYQKFKQIITSMLEALGFDFDSKFTAAHAVDTIFRVIDDANPRFTAPTAMPTSSPPVSDIDPNTDFNDLGDGEESGIMLSPLEKMPEIELNIGNTKCN